MAVAFLCLFFFIILPLCPPLHHKIRKGGRYNEIKEYHKILHSNLLPKVKQEHIRAYHEKDIACTLELLNAEDRSKFYPIFHSKDLADILEH